MKRRIKVGPIKGNADEQVLATLMLCSLRHVRKDACAFCMIGWKIVSKGVRFNSNANVSWAISFFCHEYRSIRTRNHVWVNFIIWRLEGGGRKKGQRIIMHPAKYLLLFTIANAIFSPPPPSQPSGNYAILKNIMTKGQPASNSQTHTCGV